MCKELEKVIIGSDMDKYFQVGTQLRLEEKEELLGFLRENIVVFAWSTYEAPGVDPNFICYHLKVNPAVMLKRRPPPRSFKEHTKVVKEEVVKLKRAGATKEAFYPEWLANTVVVKKKSGKWRVFVDFTDLNKAFPKDHFPVPQIDQLVNATVGYPRMSFSNAF